MFNRGIRRLAGDARGATVIEYAIVLPVLLLLVMGIVEYNTIMYAMSVLDGALFAAAREGTTNYVNSGSAGVCPSPVVSGVIAPQTQAQYINCLMGYHTNGLFTSSKLQISYNDTGSTSFNSGNNVPTYAATCTNDPTLANPPTFPFCSENAQNAGDIVIYTVTYPWTIYTPILRPFLGSGGTLTLSASTVVKNEPYSITSTR